ncbi:MAG: adenylosuccinate lyase [Oligoflexales bacterium]|nr:adenylosuccinate lyase [Oligoflexales bacterium]
MNPLFSLSPLDGRYQQQTAELAEIFSESGLNQRRVHIEAAWLLHLAKQDPIKEHLKLSSSVKNLLEALCSQHINEEQLNSIKKIEETTNHDVKACEYFLRDLLNSTAKAPPYVISYIHFACTSEDINNLAYGLSLKEAREKILVPKLNKILNTMHNFAELYAEHPMLARTHGQAASPTTVGKEWALFCFRIERKLKIFKQIEILGKINGAVGNYNAHHFAFPECDWQDIARNFVEEQLQLNFNPITTQIESHDALAELCQALIGINSVFLDLVRDVWGYISIGYFSQKQNSNEVGSSTMPHKVNPIDFENAEGNLGLANSIASHFSQKLPISRWQRDLSDSTVQRSLGVMLGYSLLAWKSIEKGLGKISINSELMLQDLNKNPEVLGEAIQTALRKYGVTDAYERLKQFTRGKTLSKSELNKFVNDCKELPASEKKRFLKYETKDYIGLAPEIARTINARAVVPKTNATGKILPKK